MIKKLIKIVLISLLFVFLTQLSTFSQTITTLATGLSNPNALATDSTFIFWIEYGSGTVKKISNTGGSVTTLANGLFSPTGICLDNTDVYFGENYGTNSARIKKVSKTGGTVTTIIGNLYSIEQLIVDNDYVYFGDFNGNKIQKILKTGGTVITISTQTNSPTGIVIDENYVYWTEFTNPGSVKKVSKSGGTTTTLGNNSNGLGIAVDISFVYWTENVSSNQGKINKAPLVGGSTSNLATGLNYAYDLCIDQYNVYWIENRTNGALKQVSVNGGTVMMLANNLNEPVRITSDDLFVYWIERNGGTNGSLKKTNKILTGLSQISSTIIPNSFSLHQNYPNPFNPSTQIRFDVSKSSFVKLIVYDILGKEVTALVNEELKAGEYSVDWNALTYPSGIYFYKLTAGDFSETKKMVLIK